VTKGGDVDDADKNVSEQKLKPVFVSVLHIKQGDSITVESLQALYTERTGEIFYATCLGGLLTYRMKDSLLG